MDEDAEAPLHFGTNFFITVTTTINMELCEITLRSQDEQLVFNNLETRKYPQLG